MKTTLFVLLFSTSAFLANAQQTLKISPITNWSGDLGSVTFTQNQKSIFYFDRTKKSGKIIINGKVYTLNSEKNIADGYILAGKGISIQAKHCNYADTEGGDCFYGTFSNVTVTVNNQTISLKNVSLQDCPIIGE